METLLVVFFVGLALAVFGFRKVLFGDQPFRLNRDELQKLIKGGSLERLTGHTNPDPLMGKTGTVYSVLKPAGKVRIEGEIYEAFTDGGYLEKGTAITVVGKGMNKTLKVREKVAD